MAEPDIKPPKSKEEAGKLVHRRETLLAVIANSYWRMATNDSADYRADQLKKCEGWLRELTELHELDPVLFNIDPERLYL